MTGGSVTQEGQNSRDTRCDRAGDSSERFMNLVREREKNSCVYPVKESTKFDQGDFLYPASIAMWGWNFAAIPTGDYERTSRNQR